MESELVTLSRLAALTARRVTAIERALKTLATHVGNEALAAELMALAHASDRDTGSLLHRLARHASGR